MARVRVGVLPVLSLRKLRLLLSQPLPLHIRAQHRVQGARLCRGNLSVRIRFRSEILSLFSGLPLPPCAKSKPLPPGARPSSSRQRAALTHPPTHHPPTHAQIYTYTYIHRPYPHTVTYTCKHRHRHKERERERESTNLLLDVQHPQMRRDGDLPPRDRLQERGLADAYTWCESYSPTPTHPPTDTQPQRQAHTERVPTSCSTCSPQMRRDGGPAPRNRFQECGLADIVLWC